MRNSDVDCSACVVFFLSVWSPLPPAQYHRADCWRSGAKFHRQEHKSTTFHCSSTAVTASIHWGSPWRQANEAAAHAKSRGSCWQVWPRFVLPDMWYVYVFEYYCACGLRVRAWAWRHESARIQIDRKEHTKIFMSTHIPLPYIQTWHFSYEYPRPCTHARARW